LDGERKSVEPMASRMPDGNVQALQQFISQSPWEYSPIRRKLAERMAAELVPECAWVISEVGFPKQGRHSVGVARQHVGALGRKSNCQVAVGIHLVTDEAAMPLDYRLYLPKLWTEDPARLREVGAPENVIYKTKWELALELIDGVRSWGVPQGVAVIDSTYGRVEEFRRGLIDRGLFYMAEVDPGTLIYEGPLKAAGKRGRPGKLERTENRKTISVEEFASKFPSWKFKTIRWREGTKKRQAARFAVFRVEPASEKCGEDLPPFSRQWLVIEWPRNEKKPLTFRFSNLPPDAGLRRLVRSAKIGWRAEQTSGEQKSKLGLDHFEGRGYLGWHHHVTMNMIAYGFSLFEKLRHKRGFWLDSGREPDDDPERSVNSD
jgi:SRSO17 transposase